MQRKIFIGIDLPERTKNHISKKIEKWNSLPIRWVAPKNFHVTLIALGYIEDEQVMNVCQTVEKTCKQIEMFDIFLNSIEFGPDQNDPKILWVTGDLSEELKMLQETIEKSLDIFVREKKAFRPHITLGRIRKTKWQKLEDKPYLQEKISVPLNVEDVTVFESTQESGQREYISLEVCSLR